MMNRDTPPDQGGPKPLKVPLPIRIHLQLHQLKVLTGQSIPHTVQKALDAYFEDVHKAQVNGEVTTSTDPERM